MPPCCEFYYCPAWSPEKVSKWMICSATRDLILHLEGLFSVLWTSQARSIVWGCRITTLQIPFLNVPSPHIPMNQKTIAGLVSQWNNYHVFCARDMASGFYTYLWLIPRPLNDVGSRTWKALCRGDSSAHLFRLGETFKNYWRVKSAFQKSLDCW